MDRDKRVLDVLDENTQVEVISALVDGRPFKAVRAVRLAGYSLTLSRDIINNIIDEEGMRKKAT